MGRLNDFNELCVRRMLIAVKTSLTVCLVSDSVLCLTFSLPGSQWLKLLRKVREVSLHFLIMETWLRAGVFIPDWVMTFVTFHFYCLFLLILQGHCFIEAPYWIADVISLKLGESATAFKAKSVSFCTVFLISADCVYIEELGYKTQQIHFLFYFFKLCVCQY